MLELQLENTSGGKISQARNTVGRNSGLDIFQIGIMNPFGRKQETGLPGFNIFIISGLRYKRTMGKNGGKK